MNGKKVFSSWKQQPLILDHIIWDKSRTNLVGRINLVGILATLVFAVLILYLTWLIANIWLWMF